MDEKDLVRRCRTGEPGARQEMYETYAGRVLAVCRRYFRESDRAQDLLHDTFLKAWDSLGSFHPRRTGSLGAWLSQIAAHLAVDELRRRKLLDGYRAVFNLFCLDGLSHREIARLLGITEKTSQTQYLKARHKLAAMIAAKYGNDEKE